MNTAINKMQLEKMKRLIVKIKDADEAYFKYDNPKMTDREYDKLVDELKNMEQSMGVIYSNSPTQTVPGEILDELEKKRHTRPMLSADKTKSVDSLVKFSDGHDVILSWKLDGLTLVLRYSYGRLQLALTRGKGGVIGEDVTHTVKTFLNVPLTIPVKDTFELRGEGVISWENFDKINFALEEPYAHPRNLAAGSTRKLDSSESKKRYLEFFAFELITDNPRITSKSEQFQFMEDIGFSVVPHTMLPNANKDSIKRVMEQFDPKKFGYPVDGIMMEYNDIAYGRSLGKTGHHENRLIAYKWEDELFETKFCGVDLAATRTGLISITGIFEPVEIDGMVSRAYLHNLDIFEEFQFGIGDTIKVYKANKIIPQIADNITMSNTYMLSMICPCCGEPLSIKRSSGGTRNLYCNNPKCTAKLVGKFDHFCEKTRMNIEGLSALTLEKFIGHGWIKSFGDLYRLEEHREEIINTVGFGVQFYNRLQKSIEKSRHCTLQQFIAGLGIPMVGRSAGRIISKHFAGNWSAFEQAIKDGFDFRTLPDFGNMKHNSIYIWYSDRDEAKLWRSLLDQIEFVHTEEETEMNNTDMNNPFFGKAVVATGKLENYTRDEIKLKLLQLGAKPKSSVSNKTDYVIVGEKAGGKFAEAQRLGIQTLTEEEFENMLA